MTVRVRFHPSVAPPPDLEPFPRALLVRLLEREAGVREGEVHCVLADDARLAELNRRFRGRRGPTDVLAFPYDPAASGGILGDIYVSLDRAMVQARERSEPVAREVWRLFVHGALHLAGRDHDTDETETAMTRIQEEWVALLGR